MGLVWDYIINRLIKLQQNNINDKVRNIKTSLKWAYTVKFPYHKNTKAGKTSVSLWTKIQQTACLVA